MSVHNGKPYLGDSIESVLRQSFGDFEFLIIDDASSDGSADILREFAGREARIRVHTNAANIGLTRSLNIGLELAQGAYIARQDADDVSLPTRLEVQKDILDANANVVLVSGRVETIDSQGNITVKLRPSRPAPSEVIPWMLLFYNYLQGHSVATFRRDAAMKVGGYDPDFRTSQDYELWLRMSRLGAIQVPETMLLQLRMHDASISRRSRESQLESGFRCSQRAIEGLCGLQLESSEIRQLRGFWKGHFGKSGTPGGIHAALGPIFEAYARKGGMGGGAPPEATLSAIRRLIRKQFNLWQRQTALTHAPLRKISAGYHASQWKVG
jgi:glycosyltransferase involved in cell wall biosynthesis